MPGTDGCAYGYTTIFDLYEPAEATSVELLMVGVGNDDYTGFNTLRYRVFPHFFNFTHACCDVTIPSDSLRELQYLIPPSASQIVL